MSDSLEGQYTAHGPDAVVDSSNWQIRIEALRASSRIVAGALVSGKPLEAEHDSDASAKDAAMLIADHFEKWLKR